MRRHDDEGGQVGGVEAVVFGVLVLVLGTLGVATAWGVVDAKLATTSAAREAARTYVEGDGSAAGWDAADRRGREAFADAGHDPASLTIARPSAPFVRCSAVTVEASSPVELPRVPLLRPVARRIVVRASHTELVDPYRAGLPRGPGACAG